MKRKHLILIIVLAAISLVFIGCGGIPETQLDRSFNFDSVRTIGIYLQPSNNFKYDQELLNLIRLKFSSLGYDIKTLSAISQRTFRDTAKFQGHERTATDLFNRTGKECDVIVVACPQWDLVPRVINTREGDAILPLTKLSLDLTLFARAGTRLLMSRNIKLYEDVYEYKKGKKIIGAAIHVMMQRALGDALERFPICQRDNSGPARQILPIVFYVDSAYLSYYQSSWDLRLQKRMLFVNDVFKRYFNTEFKVIDYRAWTPANDSSVAESLEDLVLATSTVPGIFIAGIMVNDRLIHGWGEQSEAGMARLCGRQFIACDLPYLPGMEEWNAIEESAVMIHELGHVLGACHTYDHSSAMYPSTTILSYEFDSLNAEVIKHAFTNVSKRNPKQMIEYNFNQLSAALAVNASPHTVIVPHLLGLLQRLREVDGDTSSIEPSDIVSIVADTALQQALLGHYFRKMKKWNEAEVYFKRAIELKPELVEIYFALSNVYYELDEKGRAEEYAELGQQKLDDQ